MLRRTTFVVAVAILLALPATADWFPGEPYKMHFPQMPNLEGWDVNMISPKVLADDWLCTESGPVSDIHFWFSIEKDSPETLAALMANGVVHVSIHDDIPAIPPQHSMPGKLLWERNFPVGPGSKIIQYGSGPQGWYNPNTQQWVKPDHFLFYQWNLEDILDPFVQEAGKIYWLDLSVMAPGAPTGIGWKTSIEHFNDNAVWGDLPTPIWKELLDPITGISLDLAFVITPEPATVMLLAAGLAMSAWTRRRQAQSA